MEAVSEDRAIVAFERFTEAVNLSSNLELLGTAHPLGEDGKPNVDRFEVLVIRNHVIAEGIEGAYIEVDPVEVMKVVNSEKTATFYVAAILGERNDTILHKVTRIVGYYSRVHNWNKSKVGELRDRARGEYWAFENTKSNQGSRMEAIDSL